MSRRKYKSPQGYRDGGRVPEDVVIVADPPAEAVAPLEDNNPLQRALDATRRAEELQRLAQNPLEQRLAQIEGLSDHKRNFLRQNPTVLTDPVVGEIFNRHYADALKSGGFSDDTPELDRHLVEGVAREIEQRRQQLTKATSGVTPDLNRSDEQEVQHLDDEARAHHSTLMASQSDQLAETPAMRAPAPSRKSLPVSAPVSRDVPTASGTRQSESGKITLSPEELDMARRSRPDLPSHEAERLYAIGKKRMLERKENGTYS